MVAAFLVPILIIVLLVNFVTSESHPGAGSDALSPAATAERIAPVATVVVIDASAPKTLKSGEEVFKGVCSACHAAGIAGAPKFGDSAAWSERIKQGVNVLWEHAIKGYSGKAGVMPAKGGNTDLDDVEVERAVVYMANAAGAKFKDPESPAATAAPAQAAAAATAPAAAPVAASPAPVAAAPAAGTAPNDTGKKLYETVCVACHGAGIAGAPKFADKAAWAPRIAQGLDTLYSHALNGYQGKAGMMPPKGGSAAPDDDVKAAVRFMVDAAK